MKYLKDHELEITRWVFGICLGLLMIAGILLRWLEWGEHIGMIVLDTLVPLALSVAAYLLQKRFHLLEKLTDWVECTRILAVAGPVLLAAVGIGLFEAGIRVDTYMCIAVCLSFCLVLQIWDDVDRIKALLMTTAVTVGFVFASAYTGCPGAIIAAGLLGLVMQVFGHHYWHKEPWNPRGRATNWLGAALYLAAVFLCSRVEYVTDAYWDSLFNFCARDSIYMAEDAAKLVRGYAQFVGDAGLLIGDWIRDSGNGLLYILSRAGWLPVGILIVIALIWEMAGSHLFGLCPYRNTYFCYLATLVLGIVSACDLMRLFGFENVLDLGSVLFLDGFGSNLLMLMLAAILISGTETQSAAFEEDFEDYEEPEVL